MSSKKYKKIKEPISLTLALDDNGVYDSDDGTFKLFGTKDNINPIKIEMIGTKSIHPKYGTVYIGTKIIFNSVGKLIGIILKNKPVYFDDIIDIINKIK
jgi:hypothetical protein